MAKQIISRGTVANDGTGDNLRDGAGKINDNFDEIYTAIGDGSTIDGTFKIADDSSTVLTVSANGETVRVLGGTGITTTLSSNDLTIAADTSSLITADGTATLTNKTINGPDNTITNIANSSLSNSSITLRDASSTTDTLSLGDTFNILGTTNEIETAVTNNTVTIGLPNNVTIGNNLTVTGNLTVSGTTTTVDSTTVSIQNAFVFEGATADDFETTLTTVDPTADRTISLPNATGTIVLQDSTDTLTNKTIAAGSNTISGLTNSNLSGSAAISNANLANSSITLGDDSISLGGTQTTVTNLSLDGATGTIDLTSSGNKIRFNFATDGDFPTASTYEGMYAWDVADSLPYVADDGGWVKILTENASVGDLSNVNISGVADGNVLVWSSAQGRFNAGSAGSGTFSAGSDLDQAGADIQDIGYIGHRSPDATVTKTLTVTVATKTSEHTAFGDGSSSGYVIDGHEGAHLQLSRGVYKFDISDSSNSGHPFRFYEDEGKNIAFTSDVTTSGSGGSAGDHATLTIDDDTPTPLFYQCSSHANMGGRIDILGGKRRRLNITTDKTNTGDGSTTAFTCLANRTVDDVLVIVNGIVLTPTDDYTISGTTLTFTSAPASSAGIVFRYLG